jgi:hypothetical protein
MDLTNYPFLDILWSMFLFFVFFAWIWVVISVFIDNFRRTDHSGVAKAVWTVVIIFLPIIGVLCYMVTRPPVAVVD